MVVPGKPTAPLVEVRSQADWDRVWGQQGSGSVLAPPRYAGDGLRQGVALQAVLPESFRLLDHKAGANAGRIGPGQAFWQWRDSDEHTRWTAAGRRP
jgi:hypothetical protein